MTATQLVNELGVISMSLITGGQITALHAFDWSSAAKAPAHFSLDEQDSASRTNHCPLYTFLSIFAAFRTCFIP